MGKCQAAVAIAPDTALYSSSAVFFISFQFGDIAMSREVVVVSGVRTAIGTFGGSLKDIAPTELAAQVVREALSRAGTDGKDVGHVVFGHVVNTEPKDMY